MTRKRKNATTSRLKSTHDQSEVGDKVVLSDLGPRSDLTYRRIFDLTVSGVDLRQSLLTGSFIRRGAWTQMRFQRSDLDGIRAEQSTFIECDFSTCDIRSSHFIECKFDSCIFADSFIDDCDFDRCDLSDCSFRGSSLTQCRFWDSRIAQCAISPGTFLHNRLYNCRIEDMLLGDATISYIILRDCKLARVTINAESIGAMFGLTRDQVQSSKLVYLGKEQTVPPEIDVTEVVSQEYRKRRWYIGELVLALNFDLLSAVGAFKTYWSKSRPRFSEMGFAKGDEIQFIGDILEELSSREKLPLLALMNTLESCSALTSEFKVRNRPSSASADDAIRTLAGRASLLAGLSLNRLDDGIPELASAKEDVPLLLNATFKERPAITVSELLNSIAASSFDVVEKSCLIRSEAGSYREVVSTTLFSVVALQIFLFLINGCIVQVTELKHRMKILMRKRDSKQYRELALIPRQETAPAVLHAVQELAKYAKGLNWLSDPSLNGLRADNLEEFEVSAREEPSRKR